MKALNDLFKKSTHISGLLMAYGVHYNLEDILLILVVNGRYKLANYS